MSKPAPVIKSSEDWPIRTVGEITTLLRRGTAPTYVEESNVKAIGQRCVTNVGFDGSYARPHSSDAMGGTLKPEAGDVLINSTGTGTIGRSVVFAENSGDYIVDSHVTVARPRPTELDGRWLNNLLRSPAAQRYLETQCYTGSTNQIELSRAELGAMPLAVPSLQEQRATAELLELVDGQIDATRRLVAKLHLSLQGLSDGLASGVSDCARLALEDLCVADICYGIVQSGDFAAGGIPVLSIRDLAGDYETGLHQTAPSIDARYRRSRAVPGDVLLSIKGTIGRVGVAPLHYAGNISRELARLRFGRQVLPEYARLYFLSREAQRRLDLAVVGTTRAEVSIHVLKRFWLPVPSIAHQEHIIDVLGCVERRILAERENLAKLLLFKAGVADDLLSGRVRLPSEVIP